MFDRRKQKIEEKTIKFQDFCLNIKSTISSFLFKIMCLHKPILGILTCKLLVTFGVVQY